MSNQKLPIPLGRYRHYKNRDYQVLAVVTHSETEEPHVLYRCLYGDQSLWVRPLAMFTEDVVIDSVVRPRFAFVETMEPSL